MAGIRKAMSNTSVECCFGSCCFVSRKGKGEEERGQSEAFSMSLGRPNRLIDRVY
jgi:hypothetical protein